LVKKSTTSQGKASQNKAKPLTNIEIVTLTVYLLGGHLLPVDTEDIAKKANELAPGRFTWKKYQDQINIDNIRKRLSDAKNPRKGGYLVGSFKHGWRISENGLKFCKRRGRDFKVTEPEVEKTPPMDNAETTWQSREKARMLGSTAIELLQSKGADAVSPQEAEAFFRIDDYIVGEARQRKLNRVIDIFRNDPDLAEIVATLAKKVREK
jgi:hypothetical protein